MQQSFIEEVQARKARGELALKVLVLGSGGLSIGQAGEFDYSGTQAVRSLIEEGLEVIVVNPNIATVQTNPLPGSRIYLYPVTARWVEKIIAKEKPAAIIGGFGGQTALNCLIELDRSGVLERYGVVNLGSSVATLKMTEDRDLFARKLHELGIPTPPSVACDSEAEALAAASRIGYPVIVRAAYALGGLGSGFAVNDDELRELVVPALASSPQVLIEKSFKGWKEVEYEVMRDRFGNAITICNMENFDPLGIHTGDSIVVAPSQSLSDDEYQTLRNTSLRMIHALEIIGECNAQFALSPDSSEFYVIEVNARLSRSSALASKASGYPIAYIAAKVVLGHNLIKLRNPVTGTTSAFYEPALDYVTVKVPRWDLGKFSGACRNLGSTMKSVGEIMAIGRNFPEALQKAIRMVSERGEGLSLFYSQAMGTVSSVELTGQLAQATDTRLFAILQALRQGMQLPELYQLTAVDQWFLAQSQHIVSLEREIIAVAADAIGDSDEERMLTGFGMLGKDQWRRWKRSGFGDEQIAFLALLAFHPKGASGKLLSSQAVAKLSLQVRRLRLACGVGPVVKKIDTTAGEYPTPSNYLYFTYDGQFDDALPADTRKAVIVLGGGAYRIGTSVEFDWCAVSCSERLRKGGYRSVIINCNPETVSTDYNSSDRLYFDELTLERILDVSTFEGSRDVVTSMGGQLPNKLAMLLASSGMHILGHSPATIDQAENRSRFSAILDTIGIDQPTWTSASSKGAIEAFITKVGFPVLIRPSYVLSGAAMRVAYDWASLTHFLEVATDISEDHPVVISEFLTGAREIELDGVACKGDIITSIVSEHIENAGIHSGDATTVVPAQRLYVETVRQVKKAGRLIAKELGLNGPFNIQFLARDNRIKVIECNARAARSFPFISKTVGLNLAEVATDVLIGRRPELKRYVEDELPHVGVKAALFSFARLRGADPVIGVEMASTGEVGCLGSNFEEALLLAMEASHITPPARGVLISAGPEKDKFKFLSSAAILRDLGVPMYATDGTARYLSEHGFTVAALPWPGEGPDDVLAAIKSRKVDLVLNIPKNLQAKELSRGSTIRQTAAQFGVPLLTNVEKINAYMKALATHQNFADTHEPQALLGWERQDGGPA